MRRIFLTILFMLMMASGANACVERAIIRDMDFFTTNWTNGRVNIILWDSPGMVKIVGKLRPGAMVEVLGRSQGFLKVKAPEGEGGYLGWISQKMIELTFMQPKPDEGEECRRF